MSEVINIFAFCEKNYELISLFASYIISKISLLLPLIKKTDINNCNHFFKKRVIIIRERAINKPIYHLTISFLLCSILISNLEASFSIFESNLVSNVLKSFLKKLLYSLMSVYTLSFTLLLLQRCEMHS